MSQFTFDEAMGERLEVLYRTGDMLRRRGLVREALAAHSGERILDVGCGPGFYAAELLEQVGPDGRVVGVDQSEQMLALAERRCAGNGTVAFRTGEATALPVDDETFDAALSVQVLEYVPDATAALAEMHRALRAGGRILVWDVDWATVSWYSTDPARMARVLQAWDEHLAHPSLPSTLAARLHSAGFADIDVAGHVFPATALEPDAYGGAITALITDFVPGRGGVTAEETAAWMAEQHELSERGEFFFACVQFCFTASKPG
ncbi:MAG: methyltransferase domain-containing protein [Acidimicrobiales bacterium]